MRKRLLWIAFATSVLVIVSVVFLVRSGPPYSIRRAREAELRQDLFTMRDLLNQYYIDHGRYAHSLEDLVQSGYMKEIPADPITGRNDTWVVERFKGPETGVMNIRSGSSQNSTNGAAYNTW